MTARLRGISAVSARVAWASGAGGTVLRTTDGGDTWTTVPSRTQPNSTSAISTPSATRPPTSSASATARRRRIYKTTDGGQQWTLQFTNDNPKVFLDAMAFWSEDRGVALSDSVDGRFVIFATTNGGRAWERIPAASLPAALANEGAYAASGTNVAVFKDHVWIGTTASRVLHSPDRGRTWTVAQTPLPTSASAGIFSIAFRDALHGIVVGGDYQKEREAIDNAAITSDGGKTWQLVKGLSGYRSVVAHRPGTRALVDRGGSPGGRLD